MQLALPDAKAHEIAYPNSIHSIWKVLKRRRAVIINIFLALFFVVCLIVLIWPPTYRAAATILIEQQEIPQDLVRSTVTSIADQRIELISQRVMNTSNLWEIIKKYELYRDMIDSEPREVIVERMRDDINRQMISADVMDPRSGRPAKATLAFKISYDNDSPQLAYKVANELTTLFLDENLKTRENLATQAFSFLEDESERIKSTVVQIESKLAKFKQENEGKLPDMQLYNLQAAERIARDLGEIDRQISLQNNRMAVLRAQLGQLSPQNQLVTDSGEKMLSPEGRLKFLESQYASLIASYSASHPDVIRAKREIDALRKQVGSVDVGESLIKQKYALEAELVALEKRYSVAHPDVKRKQLELEKINDQIFRGSASVAEQVKADNPAWIQMDAELKAALYELKTLNEKRALLSQEAENYKSRIAASPEVEKQFKALMLDYENAMHKYQETRNKQMEAKLAQSLETERKGERFTLVEPPLLPEEPVKPNKSLMFIFGLMLAISAAFGAAVFLEKLDESFYGRESVIRALGVSPLVAIPHIEIDSEKEEKNKRAVIGLFIAILLGLLSLISIHYLYKPIDVIWFLVMRKIGLS